MAVAAHAVAAALGLVVDLVAEVEQGAEAGIDAEPDAAAVAAVAAVGAPQRYEFLAPEGDAAAAAVAGFDVDFYFIDEAHDRYRKKEEGSKLKVGPEICDLATKSPGLALRTPGFLFE